MGEITGILRWKKVLCHGQIDYSNCSQLDREQATGKVRQEHLCEWGAMQRMEMEWQKPQSLVSAVKSERAGAKLGETAIQGRRGREPGTTTKGVCLSVSARNAFWKKH